MTDSAFHYQTMLRVHQLRAMSDLPFASEVLRAAEALYSVSQRKGGDHEEHRIEQERLAIDVAAFALRYSASL